MVSQIGVNENNLPIQNRLKTPIFNLPSIDIFTVDIRYSVPTYFTPIWDERYTRMCLRIIRQHTTKPDTILPNGLSAAQFAHIYIQRSLKTLKPP